MNIRGLTIKHPELFPEAYIFTELTQLPMAPFIVLPSRSDALLHSRFPCLEAPLEVRFFQAIHDPLTRRFHDFLGLKMRSLGDFFHLRVQKEVIRC